jgi:hypothetical protein
MVGDMVGRILGKGTGKGNNVTGVGVGNIIGGKKKCKKKHLGLGKGQTGNATTESVMGNILRK